MNVPADDVRREIRKTLIRLAQKQQKLGTGSGLDFLRRRTARVAWPDLAPVLGGIPWAVVGAVATRRYMAERATLDIDFAVRTADAGETRARLRAAGFTYEGELSIGGALWRAPDGGRVDVLEVAEPWLCSGIVQAAQNRDPQGLPVLPLPELVLMKYRAGRLQDTADVGRMLGQADERAIEGVRALFAREAQAEMEDLESLIRLGKLELQGPGDPGG